MPAARILFWAATCGALALFVRSFWLGPVPLPVAMAATLGYLALVFSGYIFPRWGMFADVIDEALPGRNLVALTFDDGPDPSSTPIVLEALRLADAKATFFVIGRKARAQPELVHAILADGHELGLHGYSHSRLTAFRSAEWMKKDLTRGLEVLTSFTSESTNWFRPPIGHVTPRLAKVAKELNLTLLCWTIRGLDGLPGADTTKIVRRVTTQLRDGAIVALHDAIERQSGISAGAKALPAILESMQKLGLRSVTVTELLEGTPLLPDRAKTA